MVCNTVLIAKGATTDADEFDKLVLLGAELVDAGKMAKATETLERALDLWRDRPYPELDNWTPAAAEVARLVEVRLATEEQLGEIRFHQGVRRDQLIADLEQLVVEEPGRERRWWLLIEARRAAGRAAEALQTFERARMAFIESSDAEPGPLLQRTYRSLLDETHGGDAYVAASLDRRSLPRTRGPLIGRIAELEALHLAVSQSRLVTVTGIGGTGKTRLAIEVARRCRSELTDIDELCVRVDGLPLAIELAAARAAILSPAQMIDRFDDPFDLLDVRPSPERRSTLQSVVEWSTSLLNEVEGRVLRCLSVFPGSFDSIAAAAVVDEDEFVVLGHLEKLSDASLMTIEGDAEGRRWRLLDTVRANARSSLDEGDESALALSRLVAWAVSLADRYSELAVTSRHADAVTIANRDRHNIRAALDHATSQSWFSVAARIMLDLEDWWRATSRTAEAWTRYLRILDTFVELRDSGGLLARLASAAGLSGIYVQDSESQISGVVSQAWAHLDEIEDPEERLTTWCLLLVVEFDEDDPDFEAKALAALELARKVSSGSQAALLHFLAIWQLTNAPDLVGGTTRACAEALGVQETTCPLPMHMR